MLGTFYYQDDRQPHHDQVVRKIKNHFDVPGHQIIKGLNACMALQQIGNRTSDQHDIDVDITRNGVRPRYGLAQKLAHGNAGAQ